jgi:hypothetical protein
MALVALVVVAVGGYILFSSKPASASHSSATLTIFVGGVQVTHPGSTTPVSAHSGDKVRDEVRGTEFAVIVEQDASGKKTVRIDVYSGSVDARAANTVVSLTTGQSTTIAPGAPPTPNPRLYTSTLGGIEAAPAAVVIAQNIGYVSLPPQVATGTGTYQVTATATAPGSPAATSNVVTVT